MEKLAIIILVTNSAIIINKKYLFSNMLIRNRGEIKEVNRINRFPSLNVISLLLIASLISTVEEGSPIKILIK